MMRRARFDVQGFLAIDAAWFGRDFDVVEPKPFRMEGAAAIVDICGPLCRGQNWLWDDYASIQKRVEAALASNASAVVMKLDSPGGDANGAFDLARTLRKASQAAGKPLFAYCDNALSAAYAIACAADRIIVSLTSSVGSIGCIATLIDVTQADKANGMAFSIVASGKRKADGNPHVPLTDEALAATQAHVDTLADVFFSVVAAARGVTPGAIKSLEAAVFIGKDGVRVGLADAVSSFEDFVSSLSSGEKGNSIAARGGLEVFAMSDYEKALAALRASAKGDGDDAKKARAALKAMGEDDEKKDDDKDKDKEAKSESEPPKKDDEKKDEKKEAKAEDEKKDDKEAKASSDLSLAAVVQSLTARLDAKEEAEERARLMASRPDFAPDVVAFLETQSIASVRKAVETFERRPGKSTAAAALAAAQPSARATVGERQGDGTSSGGADYTARGLDEQMGLAAPANRIKSEGTRLILGVMTPDQARALMAERAAASKTEGAAR